MTNKITKINNLQKFPPIDMKWQMDVIDELN